jgi:hypothetical protein
MDTSLLLLPAMALWTIDARHTHASLHCQFTGDPLLDSQFSGCFNN